MNPSQFTPKSIIFHCALLLTAILLAALTIRNVSNENDSTTRVRQADGIHLKSQRTNQFEPRKESGLARKLIARNENDPILSDPIGWIGTERESNLGTKYKSCLDQNGNVSTEQLLALGVDHQDIERVTICLNELKSHLSSVIKLHIEIEDEGTNLYRIRAFRKYASPVFVDTFRSLSNFIGATTADHVMSAFPLEDFVGFMGLYDTVFQITTTDSTLGNIEDESRVDFTYFDSNGKPGIYGFKNWSAFKHMLMGAMDTKNASDSKRKPILNENMR